MQLRRGGGGVLFTCKSSTDLEKMLGIAEGNIWREAILEHFAVLNDDFFYEGTFALKKIYI